LNIYSNNVKFFFEKENVKMENQDFNKNRLISIFSKIVKTGNFTLSSGKKSDFYINCKELLLKHQCMVTVGSCIWDILLRLSHKNVNERSDSIQTIAGVTSGADPIICSMVGFYWMNGLFIRKEKKGYGTKNLIEGCFTKGADVLIVDDVLTSGKAIRHAYNVLVENGLKPRGVIVLVDREENDAVNLLENDLGIPIYSIMTKTELFKKIEDDKSDNEIISSDSENIVKGGNIK